MLVEFIHHRSRFRITPSTSSITFDWLMHCCTCGSGEAIFHDFLRLQLTCLAGIEHRHWIYTTHCPSLSFSVKKKYRSFILRLE
ncbi:unnamed protein product [Cylicocyclus nassatus]|uniref:Uncharacterized protein n=1 Tax=Cylicocyclus nassatus TaxID=53992 RepID=A0AA36HFA7_CYLNA|nr:unnamed protein product [Cylicocyclus nassatus]